MLKFFIDTAYDIAETYRDEDDFLTVRTVESLGNLANNIAHGYATQTWLSRFFTITDEQIEKDAFDDEVAAKAYITTVELLREAARAEGFDV